MKKLKERCAFTLVELIVVLVILAILAALLIPALTGYIDKAKEKSVTAECRQVVMAAQTLADEKYAEKDGSQDVTFAKDGTPDVTFKQVADLAEVDKDNIKGISCSKKITEVKYTNKGIYILYDGSGYKKTNSSWS